jgi:hypothetical protein
MKLNLLADASIDKLYFEVNHIYIYIYIFMKLRIFLIMTRVLICNHQKMFSSYKSGPSSILIVSLILKYLIYLLLCVIQHDRYMMQVFNMLLEYSNALYIFLGEVQRIRRN